MKQAIIGRALLAALALSPSVAPGSEASEPALRVQPIKQLAAHQGVVVERQRWLLGSASGWVWRAHIALPGQLRVAAARTVRPLEAFLPDDSGPWVAINGGFYDVDGTPMGLVVSNGQVASSYRLGGGSGILELRGGQLQIVHRSEYQPGARQALQSIDRIVADGRSLVTRRSAARSAARSVVALSDHSLWFLLVTGDGDHLPAGSGRAILHSAASRGLPLWAVADYILLATDARDALNLDGSVSAQLAAKVGTFELHLQGIRGTINALLMRPAP